MKRKIYAPVTDFEQATSYCPLYLAWLTLDEARDYFQTPIPEAFADKLAHRAQAVFARHPFWARKAAPRAGSRKTLQVTQFQSQRQREFILIFMRHWLAGVLAKERPALFRDLPESFKVGQPLPPYHKSKTVGLTCRSASKLGTRGSRGPGRRPPSSHHHPANRFAHGCELLPV
jgi:hypothetical protein